MAEFEFSKSFRADGRPILSASELARFANFLNDVPSQFRKILAQSAFKKSPFESPEAMILAMRECSEQWVRKEERRLPALRALLESYAEEDPDLLDSAMAEFEVTPSVVKVAGGAAASAHPTVDSSLVVSAGAGSESAAKESEVLAATPADHLFVPPAKRGSPNQENAARDYYHDKTAGREETLVGRKSLSPTEVQIEEDDDEASHLPGGSMKKP